MVNFINSWAEGIILTVVISCIIELILPEGNNKKYVKTVIGVYVLFVMIYPVISIVSNKKIDIDAIINDTAKQMTKLENNNIALETNRYIEETYKEKLKEDISLDLKQEGYNVNFLKLDIETENENAYGQIKSINIQISKIQKAEETNTEDNIENKIVEVKTVDIKLSNETYIKSKNDLDSKVSISAKEIENLRDFLSKTYEIAKEKIFINE